MLDPKEEATKLYNGDVDAETGAPVDDWGYSESERKAFVAGAKFERDQIIEFIQRLKKVEQDSLPSLHASATERAMSGYAVGEFDGILHVLERRNAE